MSADNGRPHQSTVSTPEPQRRAATAAPRDRLPTTLLRWLGDPLRAGFVVLCAIGVVGLLTGIAPVGTDITTYWLHRLPDPYTVTQYVSREGGYFYSPAFTQLFVPMTVLPLRLAASIWLLVLLLVLYRMAGRWAAAMLLLLPVAIEVQAANIHLLLAAVALFGLRYPGLWAFAFLTKVTPGIGVVWFVFRGEWRQFAIALGTTAAIAGVSFLLAPGLWAEWIALLRANSTADPGFPAMSELPLVVRLLISLALVWWGARTDRPWTVVVASMVSLPVIWWNSPAMLVALSHPSSGIDIRGIRRPRTILRGVFRSANPQ